MNRPNYIAAVAAGLFLGNAIPHFVAGLMGQSFPSPFAWPIGEAHSSPLVNALWGLFNLYVGYRLLLVGKVSLTVPASMNAVFGGLAIVAVMLSVVFGYFMGNPSF